MAKKLIGSVTKHDCTWQYFRAGGNGGQAQNKTNSGVRCKHPPSGAVGEARDNRSQLLNKRAAFRRMAESKEFQMWVKIQAGEQLSIEAEVENQMQPHNIRVEVREDGEWVEDANTT